jgi:hypothetical protein
VDGEIGRIEFAAHSVNCEGMTCFNTAVDLFPALASREYYRTVGFNELALQLSANMSYRKTSEFLNRVRWQTDNGTPMRTLASIVEDEGQNSQTALEELALQVFETHNFSKEGVPTEDGEFDELSPTEVSFSHHDINAAIRQYNQDKKDAFQIDVDAAKQLYEQPANTVNVSIDDVGVKKQKETGRSVSKLPKESREYVQNTIAHIEKEDRRYILNGTSTGHVLQLLIAFLLYNNLLRENYLVFFVDGARSLQATILTMFQWFGNFRVILDWYHLEKKCEYELSLALRGIKIRKKILEELLPLLWLGKIDDAITFLRSIPTESLKTGQSTDRLIGYFERNRANIPCYALRKKLGLRNSSNKGEKANDQCVASRQKHQGMSWSKPGSVALATISAMQINKEHKTWCSCRKLNFRLVS